MRCLVTGGAGFIGSHVAAALVVRGDAVRILDDFSSGRPENLAAIADRVEIVRGDVRDPETCARAAAGVGCVFHLAAMPSVPRSIEDPTLSVSVNEIGTVTLLEAAVRAGATRFVYSSSSSVYGDGPILPKREDQAPAPISPYGAGKLAGEYACRAFSSVHPSLRTVCLRYFNVYGPRQDPHSAYAAVIPAFLAAALAGRPPIVYGDGLQTRDFTYVEDVAAANLAAAACDIADGAAVNVAAGGRTSLLDLLAAVQEICGTRLTPDFRPPRPGDIRDSWADVALARARLGFAAATPLTEGLRRTAAFLRETS